MSNWKYEKFKGQALLEKLKTISHLSHSERAKQCGYYDNIVKPTERRQQVELNLSEFYDAILEAKRQERELQGKQNQPKPFDAVIGGEVSPPVAGMVLGGINGIKNRLNSVNVETRVTALSEALKHGAEGADLVVAALEDSSSKVRSYAYEILVRVLDDKFQEAVSKFDKLLLFTRLQDWKAEIYDEKVGAVNPSKTAYIIKSLQQFQLLIQNPLDNDLQALILQINNTETDSSQKYNYIVDLLFDACDDLKNLKALSIKDDTTSMPLGDVSALLKVYPKLEILQINNGFNLDFSPIRHTNLKTLIINTRDLGSKTIQQIYKLELPELEYIDIGFGYDYNTDKPNTPAIAPILSSSFFPKLRYLGIRNGKDYNKLASAIVRSPLVNRLLGLDISNGTLGDKGAEVLYNCYSSRTINNLLTLNVSHNYLSSNMVTKSTLR